VWDAFLSPGLRGAFAVTLTRINGCGLRHAPL
jgi:hypothetical protein